MWGNLIPELREGKSLRVTACLLLGMHLLKKRGPRKTFPFVNLVEGSICFYYHPLMRKTQVHSADPMNPGVNIPKKHGKPWFP